MLAVVNLTTDCAVFALPLPVVGALNLPRRQKMLLVGVFSLGVFPCAVSIYRFRALGVVAAAYDPTWDRVDSATWSSLELTVGVVTVCLLTLRPLLAAAFPRVFATVLRRSSTADTVGRGSDRRRAAARAAAAQRVGLVSARTKGWEGSTRELNCSRTSSSGSGSGSGVARVVTGLSCEEAGQVVELDGVCVMDSSNLYGFDITK